MKNKRRSRKTFGKVLSVVLCLTILVSTYGGFFSGFRAFAGNSVDTSALAAGEVGLSKSARQDGRSADITVQTAAKPVEITETQINTTNILLDVILIIDTSGSMNTDDLMGSVADAAVSLANGIFEKNAQNRVAIGSFAQFGYALAKQAYNGTIPKYDSSGNQTGTTTGMTHNVEFMNIDRTAAGYDKYFFTSGEKNALADVINGMKAIGGTNTEGGFLAAKHLAESAAAANPDRQTLVIFFTDGLPTGRYNGNTATYDGAGSGIPNYRELTEMMAEAENLSNITNTQTGLIFYAGKLNTGNSNTKYDGSSTLPTRITNSSTEEQKLMYNFYKKSDYKAADYIVNTLLAPYCEAGIYMPGNEGAMLQAFKDIITSYEQNYKYEAAAGAVYTDIIPEHYDVDEASISVSMGTASVLKDQQVTIDGVVVTRDVVEWRIGTIPETVQTLEYTINVNDPRLYGILDIAEQGILTYTESPYTKTASPLIVQIDEIILAPKGADDYYVIKQGDSLNANNAGVAGVKTNDDALNTLVDETGNAYDSQTIVNGNIAGLDGTQAALNLENYTTKLVNGAQHGQVVLNEDGTFTYVPNSELFTRPMVDFTVDPNGSNEYNYSGTVGWEDTFTYRLDTAGTGGFVTKSTTTTTTTITPIYAPELSLIVFEDMRQDGADVEGTVAIGGNLTIDGSWTVASNASGVNGYVLLVGGVLNGNINLNRGQWAQNEEWIRKYVDQVEAHFTALSNQFSAMAPVGTSGRNQWYTPSVQLTADNNHKAGTPYVFYVDGNQQIGEVNFIGTFTDDPIIVNVSGKQHSINGGQWGMGSLSQDRIISQVVWNFYEAETISSNGFSFNGVLLAPKATYNAANGHVNGTCVVKYMNGLGGFEYHMKGAKFNDYISNITVEYTTETSSSTSTETYETTVENYVITTNEGASADSGLESEVITAHIRIIPNLSDLTATKEASPAGGSTVKAGDEITYTINVTNPCSVAVQNIVVNDSAPFGTTIKNANGGAVDGRNISFTIADLPAGATKSVSFTVAVDSEITGTNNLENTANVTYTLPGESTPSSSVTNTVNHAVLTAEKSSSVAADAIIAAGGEITYTIAVTNRGTAAAQDVRIVDTLSDGVTFKEGAVDYADGVVSTTIGSIGAGQTVYVTFTVTVNQITSGAKLIENTATVNDVPTNTVVNVTKYGTVVVKYVDESGKALLEEKNGSGVTGSSYGPYPSENIENYRLIKTEGSATGIFTEGETVIIYTYAKIPGNATVYYVDEAGNSIANTETITGWQGDNVTDLLVKDIDRYEFVSTDAPTTVLTEDGITIIHHYKLIPDATLPTVVKTADPANGSLVKTGDTITYFITVTNNKYEAMTNVTVKDTAPLGTQITNANSGTVSGDTISFVIPTIESGASATVSFTVAVSASLADSGNLSNTAKVIYRDREASADTEIDTNTTGHAILTAEKTGGADAFYGVGDTYTYNITVTNRGSAAAANIKVIDNVPAGTSLFDGKSASVSGNKLSWTIDKLEAGASKTVSFDVTVNDIAGFSAFVSNTAYVNDIPTNTTENTVKKGTVDVRFVDEANNELADSLHYEGKPGTAHGTTEAIDIYGYSLKQTNGTTDGTFADGNITIVHVYERLTGTAVVHYIDKTSGQDILDIVNKSGWVGDAIDSDNWTEITNYTYVSTDKPEDFRFIDGNVDIIHYYTFIEADDTPLDFVKAANPISGTLVNNGDVITYIVTLTNTRIDPVNNVVITDYVPDGMTFVSASEGAVYENGKLTWNVGIIEVGGKATVFFDAKVNDSLIGSGNIRNIASATFSNRDNEPENPIYTNEVVHPIIDAKLESFTNQPDANLTEGDEIIYKITVTNNGSAPATNVPVIADIPDGTTFVSSEDGVSDGDSFTTTIPSIEPGQVIEIIYKVVIDTLPEGVYEEPIPNIANVGGEDTNDVLDTAYVGILIVKYVDYNGALLAPVTTDRARVGTPYGSLPILDFTNRAFDYVEGARIGNYIKGTITVVFHYELIPATLTVRYIDKDTGEEIKNLDVYTGFNQGDVIPESYAEPVEIGGYIYSYVETPDVMKFITPTAEIIHFYERILDTDAPSVTKASDPISGAIVKAGDTITYSIAVTNVRATDALENVVVTDAVPTGAQVKSIANGGVEANGVITWTIGSIPAGETKVVSFSVTVDSGLTGGSNLGNVAHVAYRDVQKGEDKEIPTNSTSHALITSSKSTSVPAGVVLYAGDIITYTIDVKNIGTADADSVTVYDAIPEGTGIILDSVSAGATYANGRISATLRGLQPGETRTVSFRVEVLPLANGVYSKTILNSAIVNGDNTNTTEVVVKRGTLTVKYQDTAGNELHKDIVSEAAVGSELILPAEKSFYQLRLKEVTKDSNSSTYIEGNITYIYIYERIPAQAIVKYLDYNTKATLLESRSFDGYVGDILESDYLENITHYSYKMTDKPTTLMFTEEGLVIIHYYEYIYDSASIVREKTASPASGSLVKLGDTITYTINVENPRYDAISDVVITDAVPAGAAFVSADNGGAEANGTVTWNLGTLAAGASKAVTFTVKVNSSFTASGNLKNTAFVTFTGAGDNEPTTVATNDTFHAVLTYEKAVDIDATSPKNVLTYTIAVKNEGSVKAENVVVTDKVPANTTLLDGTYAGASVFGDNLTWNIAKLEAGESVELTFKVAIDEFANTEYRKIIANKAKVNGSDTNEVETVVTQGAVVVSHVAEDGVVLSPETTYVGEVGASYSFDEIQSEVYKLKTIEGEPDDTFIEGVKYVKFIYEKREAGLTIRYLEYGTNEPLSIDTYTKTMKVGEKVEDERIELIPEYEYKTSTYSPDNSLVMTKDGIEIIHYYTFIPTGDVIVKYVDVNYVEIADSETLHGDIYTSYSVEPKVIEGYDYTRTEGEPSGKFPAYDTAEVTFVYTRSTGTLVVRYLEQDTNKPLDENYTKVYNTGDSVTDLRYHDIPLYEKCGESIPESLIMTKDGIEVIYYYNLIPTGTATAHYVDTEGNELLDDYQKAGNIYETYTFTPADIDSWHLVETRGAETGNFPAYANNDVTYVYERDTGVLTVFYLEEGTNNTLSQAYSETMNTGTAVEDLHERDIPKYELVKSSIPKDLVMTTAGLTITYWYSYIPTGEAIAHFVDTEGNKLNEDITVAGDVYHTYSFTALDIEGYKLISTEGSESGNFPAYATDEVTYVYQRCEGVLTVNYLEKDTNEVLSVPYSETMYTGIEVKDLHAKSIAYYKLAEKDIPESLIMTEDGIVINYYYSKVPTGVANARYVDENGEDLIVPNTTSGVVETKFEFVPEVIEGYEHVATEGKPSGTITEKPQEVIFTYKRQIGTLVIRYLEKDTNKVLSDSYTEQMETGETVTNLRTKSIPSYVRTSTEKPNSLEMTINGIEIIHYYAAIPVGSVQSSHVDEEGNELVEGDSLTDFVDTEYEYKPAEIPGYELIEVEGEPTGSITEEEKEVIFIYRRLEGTLLITYVDETTGKPVAEAYTEVMNVNDTVTDLKEISVDGYELTKKDIPNDLTMTTDGLDIVYYFKPDTYTVGGTAWHSSDNNSTYNKGTDTPVEDIEVVLYDGNKTIVGTAQTDKNGEYTIDNVESGKYTVSFSVPSKYSVVDTLPYSDSQMNSVADYTGRTGILNVTGDLPNVGLGMEGIVLGSSATNDDDVATNFVNTQPQTVNTPVTNNQQNATYTKVLGDTGSGPATGDFTGQTDSLTVVAVMLVSCSLFVLTMARKRSTTATPGRYRK